MVRELQAVSASECLSVSSVKLDKVGKVFLNGCTFEISLLRFSSRGTMV